MAWRTGMTNRTKESLKSPLSTGIARQLARVFKNVFGEVGSDGAPMRERERESNKLFGTAK